MYKNKINNKIKIALIGARGLGGYGGAETFVREVSKLLKNEYEVIVGCEDRKFSEKTIDGIRVECIRAVQHPTLTIPTINDIIMTIYLLNKHKDLQIIHYHTPDGAPAALIAKLAGRKVTINPDGIEWRRLIARIPYIPTYQKPIYLITMLYMLTMEFLSTKIPDVTIADSIAIKERLKRIYKTEKIEYIAYGATKHVSHEIPKNIEQKILKRLELKEKGYYLTIGRLVAENNIHMEIEAFRKTKTDKKLLIVGNVYEKDPYYKYLMKMRNNDERIKIIGPITKGEILHVLRKNCLAYIHAYTVGGTNPSLLEQLRYNRPIIAYDVPFHREVLRSKAIYFKSIEDLVEIINLLDRNNYDIDYSDRLKYYKWKIIAKRYSRVFRRLILNK